MTKYLYKIVSSPRGKEDWRLFISPDFPAGAQGSNAWYLQQVVNYNNSTDPACKYKLQQYPLTQEWTDVNE